jgi:TolA-binding protein
MKTILNAKPALLALSIAMLLLQGCEGGSSGSANTGESFLAVSQADLYFGTRDVGSSSTQTIVLSNQSADDYPIQSVQLSGESIDEFTTNYTPDSIILKPGEMLKVDLTFEPRSVGRKYSSLDIQHDITAKASAEQNITEQRFYKAKKLERSRNYEQSLNEYQGYIADDPVVSVNKRRANTKVPVLTESASHGAESDLRLYTSALDLRESDDTRDALRKLSLLLKNQPNSYLADDALYMKGYIQLMDLFQYQQAYYTMEKLRRKFPDSSYIDTALYVQAVSQKELGNIDNARELFEELRQRHLGMSLEVFNLQWPKDNYISRLWFERSSQGLAGLS